ncbi:hypothetical protein BC332_26076 [Capsicum chinense]|nr:hypothetical protein BC332_26076 [Capsicum chinense]
MAGGGNFIHRVISYVANELIVNGLSNSDCEDDCNLMSQTSHVSRLPGLLILLLVKKTKQSPVSNWGNNLRCCLLNMPTKRPLSLYLSASFQRFAVRTNRRMEDLSKLAQQKRQEIADQVKDVSKNFESFKNQ